MELKVFSESQKISRILSQAISVAKEAEKEFSNSALYFGERREKFLANAEWHRGYVEGLYSTLVSLGCRTDEMIELQHCIRRLMAWHKIMTFS